jgi:hypothetical protein
MSFLIRSNNKFIIGLNGDALMTKKGSTTLLSHDKKISGARKTFLSNIWANPELHSREKRSERVFLKLFFKMHCVQNCSIIYYHVLISSGRCFPDPAAPSSPRSSRGGNQTNVHLSTQQQVLSSIQLRD